jgi:glycosyltransferase involved in cell wall biosynthesis
MKVLMFGWEFPPHISGGLGTACQGLTEALSEEKVDVVFVVPKLVGGEHASGVSFVDAGKVILKKRKRSTQTLSTTTSTGIETGETEFTVLEVESTLFPYHSETEYYPVTHVQSWQHELQGTTTHAETEVLEEDEYTHTFSGNYGPNLRAEVKRYAEVAAAIAQRVDFDVIHVHDWMTFPAGVAAKRASGKPLVVHVHSTEFDRSGDQIDRRLYEIEKEGMDAADRVLAVSQWTKDIVINRYGIPREKVKVLHNGIIVRQDSPEARLSPLGTHVVTFLGRLTYQKGPLYFIAAAKKVLEKFPDAHFIMAGSGDLFPQAIERVAHLRLSSRFHFTGFLRGDNIAKIWSMSSVYVMPSVSEPFGITPLEAIQAGVPVIVSNQSGVAEVMPHAIKVDFWKTDRLAETICSILQHKSLSTTLQKNSMEAIKHITWNNAAKKIKSIYHELTSH